MYMYMYSYHLAIIYKTSDLIGGEERNLIKASCYVHIYTTTIKIYLDFFSFFLIIMPKSIYLLFV